MSMVHINLISQFVLPAAHVLSSLSCDPSVYRFAAIIGVGIKYFLYVVEQYHGAIIQISNVVLLDWTYEHVLPHNHRLVGGRVR